MSEIKIFNKEGLDFLSDVPDDSIDLVLVDPPYEISRPSGFMSSKGPKTLERFKMSYEFGEWDEQNMDLFPFIVEFHRILKKGGTCIVFYDLWKLSYLKEMMDKTKFKQLRFIEWVKTNPVPINSKINYLSNSREIALLGIKKSKPTFNSEYDNGIYRYPIYHGKDRFHPTQKSLPLFEDLIKKHSNKGDIVLDCFLGSGTTALAAKNTGRKFIGCELGKEYYEKCIKRLDLTTNKK